MRDTLSPNWRAIEKPPAAFVDGVTGAAPALDGGGGVTADEVAAGRGSTMPTARAAGASGGALYDSRRGASGDAEKIPKLRAGSGGSSTVAARAAARPASTKIRNGLYRVKTL